MTNENNLQENLNNINENVKDDTNNVETEELFIYNVTIKHGNVDSLMKKILRKKKSY